MASAVVYDDVAEGASVAAGVLFQGLKFWVAQRVPMRASYLAKIEANGGQVVKLEKQADFRIADHFRRECPPGSTSYEFIDKSIAKGELLDPDNFAAGPRLGTARDVGSIVHPAKGTRAAYTPEEDRQLYKWVRDAQAAGIAVSGNELYKQLEQKNPRHTWQSWRNRYLKKLQHLPPAVNMPDNDNDTDNSDNAPPAALTPHNAPPSPLSDQPSRAAEVPVVRRTGLVKNKDRARLEAARESASTNTAASKDQVTEDTSSKQVYSITQLAATFSTEDWEDLYAFVEHIDNIAADKQAYDISWTNWAEHRDNQTSEQWRQYYEKVVRPQWLKDPESKRNQIKRKVEERHVDDLSSPTKSQSWSQTQEAVATAQKDVTSQNITSQDITSQHIISKDITSQAINVTQNTASNAMLSDSRPESEATAQQETPQYIRRGYESALKRIRGDQDAPPVSTDAARPTKLRKYSVSPVPEMSAANGVNGTPEQPLETASRASSQQEEGEPLSEAEEELEPLPSPQRPQISQATEEDDASDLDSLASSTDLTHITPLPRPPQVPEASEDDDDDDYYDDDDNSLPSNTPTPRAHKLAAFDTQAILSPSQSGPFISRLPRPMDSSPPHHPDSEASTTHSLQEFSSYLQDTVEDAALQPPTPLPHPSRPASPTPSITSEAESIDSSASTASGDPDPPLEASEIPLFFSEQLAAGFSNEFVTKALKRTRFRPMLATTVLDAWRHAEPLPSQRGVWSIEEDELVESGDGAALARLGRKHSVDGWGGVTERMNFLRAWRGR